MGTTFPVVLTGTPGKTPPAVWVDHPGIVFKPGPVAKATTYEVSVAADTPTGPHLVRFHNDEGSALPCTFMVGTVPETTDAEPNDDARRTAQEVKTLPVTVNGKLDKTGDADSFKVTLQEGRTFAAILHSYGLGTQVDPALRLLDDQGTELTLNHDGYNLDPVVSWEVKKTGTYVVQVMGFSHPPAAEVNLKGGADIVYRLTLTQDATARFAWPPGVKRGTKTPVQPLGWNCGPEMKGPAFEVEPPAYPEETFDVMSSGPEPLLVALSDHETVLELEPNDQAATAPEASLPAALQGVLQKAGDEDRFAFIAKKGQSYVFKVSSADLHAPLDAWLRIEDGSGKMITQADDAKEASFDPTLTWKAPADGKYIIAMSDRFQRGGWDFVYHIDASLAPAAPHLAATLAEHSLKIEAGKTAEIKVKVEIAGEFKGKLTATVTGLPAGVTVKDAEVPGKTGGDVVLALTAAADVVSSNTPVEVTLATSDPDRPATYRANFDLRRVEPRGDHLVNEDSRVWLLVGAAAKAK